MLDEIQALINLYLQPESNVLAIEHKSIDDKIVTYLRGLETRVNTLETRVNRSIPRNRGWFTGLEMGGNPDNFNFPVSGDFTNALLLSKGEGSNIVRITMINPMPSMNYFVMISIESLGEIRYDDDFGGPAFKRNSTTQFEISVSELDGYNTFQNMRIHAEVISLD